MLIKQIKVASQEKIKKEVMEMMSNPKDDKSLPTLWVGSRADLAYILSNRNQSVLRAIREKDPSSLKQIRKMAGLSKNEFSESFFVLTRYGLIDFEESDDEGTPWIRCIEPIFPFK